MSFLGRLVVGLALFASVTPGGASAQTQAGKPLNEENLIKLIELQLGDDLVVAKIVKDGVGFAVDDAALERLTKAGASKTVLDAVRQAAAPQPKTSAPQQAVTYQDVLILVENGIPEESILKRLAQSPTVFTLDARQVEELKKAGASQTLLDAMQGTRPLSAAAAEVITDFAIVLDCSGSMKELTKEGETKMAAAKRVVIDLVNRIPDGLNVTFIVYGHEVAKSANSEQNCQAVKVVRPLSKLDDSGKAELVATIQKLEPTGVTPIALALRTAGKELAPSGAVCGLALITDGLESCEGDPAMEAAALVDGLKLAFGVHVVGFDVKPQESQALQKIADAGAGKYYNAASADELNAAMGALAGEIAVVAKPPEQVSSKRRAVKILTPQVEMPPMKKIMLAEAGQYANTVQNYVKAEIEKYDAEIRIPSSTTQYELWWVPKEGRHIRMVSNLALAERKVVDIRPDDYLGFIRVNGAGEVQKILAVPAGTYANTRHNYVIQEATKFGATMVVPAGVYDVWVNDNAIEEGLEVKPGKLYELE